MRDIKLKVFCFLTVEIVFFYKNTLILYLVIEMFNEAKKSMSYNKL